MKILEWIKTKPMMFAYLLFGLVLFIYGLITIAFDHAVIQERGLGRHELHGFEARTFGTGLLIFGLAVITAVAYLAKKRGAG